MQYVLYLTTLRVDDCQVKIHVLPKESDVLNEDINASSSDRGSSPITSKPHNTAHQPTMLSVDCMVRTTGKTGVEMEAMVGASAAALCIYDMVTYPLMCMLTM